jgi:RimJ/RimL family protein N-acetyltransferase
MSGYFGTERQQRLQAQAEAGAAFIRATPGACQIGRMMGCDDPDRLGWDRIDAILARDGACGFRLIPAARADRLRVELAARDFRLDSWDVFLADRATALAATAAILDGGLPDGLVERPLPADPTSEATRRIQALMHAAGVVPFSGSLLTGALGPATTVALGTTDGGVVAAAHGYLPHNAASPYRHHAWGGLAAVADAWRGKGLGTYVNARMIASLFHDLDATHVYELVSASNTASRRMVEHCGLTIEPALVCGLAVPRDESRFTH